MKKTISTGKKALLTVAIFILTALIILTVVFFGIYNSVSLDRDSIVAERAKVKICSIDGEEIGADTFNRYVKYENINTNIINAFVALEDKRFFRHHGVDYIRTAGALLHNIKAGYSKEGGSTITQQLAKNTQLSGEKTLTRKIKEMKLAHEIEKYYKKEDILEMYLNAIYYGNGIYGIDSACKNYFGKSPSELSLPESAILAGIVKSPQNYSPINHPEKALDRMKTVLRLMFEQGYIDESEYSSAQTYRYTRPETEEISPYFSAVISEACELLGMEETALIKMPYTIYTYYDETAQNNLAQVCSEKDYEAKTVGGNDAYYAAMLADNLSGGIIAYYSNKKIDPIHLRRQPGSAIKPICVYAPAFERKLITTADVYSDEKTDFNGYIPSNYKDIYSGMIDVETAVKNSVNTVAVKIFNENEMEYCLKMINNSGIPTVKEDNNLSLALGGMTYGVTMKELTESYMCFANGGSHKKCSFIEKIVSGNQTIYQKSPQNRQIMSRDTAFLMTDLLVKTAKSGTAKKLSSLPFDIASKTGTVSAANEKNTDAWNISYTAKNTLCVWYGGENSAEENALDITGGGLPTLLAANIFRNMPSCDSFPIPDGVIELEIDAFGREKDDILYLANENTPKEYRKKYWFSTMHAPTTVSPYFKLDVPPKLDLIYDAENVKLNFDIQYPFGYALFRENLTFGSADKVAEYISDKGTFTKRADFTDTLYVADSFYDYRLDIFFEGKLIKSVYSDIIILTD